MLSVRQQLAKEWFDCGIKEGDIVLIHSDTKRTLRRYLLKSQVISPQIILESFLDTVGSGGTLLLPLFNFNFANGITFDIRNTVSQMGALTEAGRRHLAAVRTGHPIYSFAAIGKDSDRFKNVNNFSGYGKDSPFAILHELGGKIAVLDLSEQLSMTFYHYIEEMRNVSYRYHKTFSGGYIDIDGLKEFRTYGLFVRDLKKGVLTNVNPIGELLWQQGLYTGCRPNQGPGLRVVSANSVYDFVSKAIDSNKARGLLYILEGEASE